MKLRFWFAGLFLILVGCSVSPNKTPTVGVLPSPSPSTAPTPMVSTTSVPDVQAAATAFLTAWQSDQYDKMYSMLTRLGQDGITKDAFTARYKDTAINLSLQSLEYQIISSMVTPKTGQVAYRVIFHTALVGDLKREMVMGFGLENSIWKVQWEEGMIMPELRGGNKLKMDVTVPARGNIYDSTGSAIAAQADAVALGVIAGEVKDSSEADMLRALSEVTGKYPATIKALYKGAAPSWYVPVGTASAQAVKDRLGWLSSFSAVVMNDFNTRYYYDGGVAPQAIGYVLGIGAEDMEEYRRKGYAGDEKVGGAGLEKWGEDALAGSRGAALYVIDGKGQIVTRLAQTDPKPAQSITTTLDKSFQVQVQTALEGFTGAIVVLERNTGRVLAMASSPSFDPNLFDPNNYNSQYLLTKQVLNANEQRLVNRATQGTYPLGSVFKIITMAAALNSGIYTKDTEYNCTSYWQELPGVTLKDWTVDKKQPASGMLTLMEGLMRSCNPYFYHIGVDLYRQKGNNEVTNMALGFGLGSATGIEQVAENPGSMPEAASEADAAQLATGQGAMLVTPLQVADFAAAVGNGGTLYRPQIVEKIASPDGTTSFTFTPEVRGTLPISADNLKIIQDSMRMVVANTRGTAYYVFTGMETPIYGKTGTAQNPFGQAHAWFAGYTDANREDKPDIAVAVIAENAGEGSEIAAPIFRRVVEIYFTGRPQRVYPWETTFYVTRTPTPLVSPTPTGTKAP